MIRLATPADAAACARIYRPAVDHSPISFETIAPSEAEMGQRITTVLEEAPWLVFEEGGEVLGYAYAMKHRARAAYAWSVDVSVYVDPSAHRRGLGRRLYETLFALLRAQGYQRAFAGITLPNAKSVGLHESFGFTSVGVYARVGFKLGAWHDVGWWQMSLREDTVPPPLLSMREAAEREEWKRVVATAADARE